MMKVKIFSNIYASHLENEINEFLERKDIEVINIQYQESRNNCGAMIIYKDKIMVEKCNYILTEDELNNIISSQRDKNMVGKAV